MYQCVTKHSEYSDGKQLFYYARGFCGSVVQVGQSRDGAMMVSGALAGTFKG
jgi:hypothetical protein